MLITEIISGRPVVISARDVPYLYMYAWYWRKDGYLVRTAYETGIRKTVYFHNMVLPPEPGYVVDHIDCDKTNNSRQNLRHLTAEESSLNIPPRKKSILPKGVTKVKNGRYRAQSKLKQGHRLSSYHDTSEQAGTAYDMFVHTHAPYVAYLNFPDKVGIYERKIHAKRYGKLWRDVWNLDGISSLDTGYDPMLEDILGGLTFDDIPEV